MRNKIRLKKEIIDNTSTKYIPTCERRHDTKLEVVIMQSLK